MRKNQLRPVAYEEAATRAREAGDHLAAARLEHTGSARCLGHGRAERHRQRMRSDLRLAGLGPDHHPGNATDSDLDRYLPDNPED